MIVHTSLRNKICDVKIIIKKTWEAWQHPWWHPSASVFIDYSPSYTAFVHNIQSMRPCSTAHRLPISWLNHDRLSASLLQLSRSYSILAAYVYPLPYEVENPSAGIQGWQRDCAVCAQSFRMSDSSPSKRQDVCLRRCLVGGGKSFPNT